MAAAITSEQWDEWLTLPQTKRLRQWAWERRNELRNQWEGGAFTDVTNTAMLARNAGATGACSAYKEIEEMDFQQIGDSDDE